MRLKAATRRNDRVLATKPIRVSITSIEAVSRRSAHGEVCACSR